MQNIAKTVEPLCQTGFSLCENDFSDVDMERRISARTHNHEREVESSFDRLPMNLLRQSGEPDAVSILLQRHQENCVKWMTIVFVIHTLLLQRRPDLPNVAPIYFVHLVQSSCFPVRSRLHWKHGQSATFASFVKREWRRLSRRQTSRRTKVSRIARKQQLSLESNKAASISFHKRANPNVTQLVFMYFTAFRLAEKGQRQKKRNFLATDILSWRKKGTSFCSHIVSPSHKKPQPVGLSGFRSFMPG